METYTIYPFNPGLELCQSEMYLNTELFFFSSIYMHLKVQNPMWH